MSDKVAIRFQPQRAEIAVERGQSVLDAALSGKVIISHKCGGHGSCGTCKVHVDSKTSLHPHTKLELRHLTDVRLAQGYRLACQCVLTGPATVTVPEDPLRRVVRELLAAERSERTTPELAVEWDHEEKPAPDFSV
ncbi:MAG: 2Fe-2S iron-sulfur cluster binding domain-containing protein [Firmicutes bacterium]|nr:2Fe-2S iron-sulfur cluster binding domain-containing protein [Bacillota bacterium]